jgi:hypothetical protein
VALVNIGMTRIRVVRPTTSSQARDENAFVLEDIDGR